MLPVEMLRRSIRSSGLADGVSGRPARTLGLPAVRLRESAVMLVLID
jgi:hypothetical protein